MPTRLPLRESSGVDCLPHHRFPSFFPLFQEVFEEIFEAGVISRGQTSLKSQPELAVLFEEQAKITFRAADVACQNQCHGLVTSGLARKSWLTTGDGETCCLPVLKIASSVLTGYENSLLYLIL